MLPTYSMTQRRAMLLEEGFAITFSPLVKGSPLFFSKPSSRAFFLVTIEDSLMIKKILVFFRI